MYIQQGSVRIYDNYGVGLADLGAAGFEGSVGLAFKEEDFTGTTMEEFSPTHIFRLSEDRIDAVIEMLQKAKGSRIHVPNAEEKRAFGK